MSPIVIDGPLITAITTGIVVVLGAITRFVRKDARAKDAKLQEIHVMVNSRLTDAINQNAQLLREVSQLRSQVADLTHDPLDSLRAKVSALSADPLPTGTPTPAKSTEASSDLKAK